MLRDENKEGASGLAQGAASATSNGLAAGITTNKHGLAVLAPLASGVGAGSS